MLVSEGPENSFQLPDGNTIFHFCPTCGTTVWFEPDDRKEGVIGIAGGTFVDNNLPMPSRVMHSDQRHPCVRWGGNPEVFRNAP